MLPIIDKPLVQYAVEEAIDSGINEIIFNVIWVCMFKCRNNSGIAF